MPAFKYKVVRRSIVEETWIVEADTEVEAIEQLEGCAGDPDRTEWIDWHDEQFIVEGEPEILDPLYVMVKDYKSVDKTKG